MRIDGWGGFCAGHISSCDMLLWYIDTYISMLLGGYICNKLALNEYYKFNMFWILNLQSQQEKAISHHHQGRSDFNTVNPSLKISLGKSLGSREIFRPSGIDFPIPPSSWWSTDTILLFKLHIIWKNYQFFIKFWNMLLNWINQIRQRYKA